MTSKMRSTRPIKLLLMLALITIVQFSSIAPLLQAQTNSAPSSLPSATPVSLDPDAALRRACGDAVDELKSARKLIEAQGTEIGKLRDLADLQNTIEQGLKDLRTLDASQKQALQDAVDAANREIAALKDEIAILKKQRMTWWKKAKYVLIGALVGAAVIALKN